MPTQTTTTTLDTSQVQGPSATGAPDNSIPRESSAKSGVSDVHTNANSAAPLPEPSNQLSAGKIEEQEFEVTFIADEDEKIFDNEYHNEDHLLQDYWKHLKQILETPCDQRVEAYQNLNRRIGGLKPAPRYEHMRDALLQWARGGFNGEPKIVFKDPNGIEYFEPRTEKDKSWEQRGHKKDKTQPSDDVILPTDMEYFIALYKNEATPLIEQIFNKPKLAQQEPGRKLVAINNKIQARVAKEQELMKAGKDPLVINVDLQVPLITFLQLMIRGTSELVKSGKTNVGDIEDKDTLSAYELLKTRLERAKQPMVWQQSLGDLVESKAARWKEHMAAGSDLMADENLWDQDFEEFVLGRAPDPEYIKRYYDGRNAPGASSDGQSDMVNNTQEEGQKPDNIESNEVEMSDKSQEGASETVNHTGMSDPVADTHTSCEGADQKDSASKFPDAVKIGSKPNHVMDGDQERKIEGYLEVGRGHSLLLRMNEPEAVPALCELTAAGPFGRATLNAYRALNTSRYIQRETDLEILKTKSIADLNCTFIATQRNTYSRTIIGGRFDEDPPTMERHYFQSQLDRAMGKSSVEGWIRTIWPNLYEDNGNNIETREIPTGEPPTTSKEPRLQNVDDGQKSQLELMQTQMKMLMEQMKVLQASLGGGIRT